MRNQRMWDSFSLEPLEPRLLLSGNVSADITPRGDLAIVGDHAANHIVIEQTESGISISGADGTTVNGLFAIELAGVDRDVRINLRGGDDRVDVIGLDVARDLRIKGGQGDDTVHLFDVDVARHLRANGQGGDDVVTRDLTTVGGKARVPGFEVVQDGLAGASALIAAASNAQPLQATGLGVMEVKLNQAIETLNQKKGSDELYMHAINEVMESLFTSNLVILPTLDPQMEQTDPATMNGFEMFNEMANEAIEALNQHILRGGTPTSKTTAAEARNFIQVVQEAMEVIAEQTRQTDPENPNNPLLEADDEGGTVVDTVLQNVIFSRQIRSPFPAFIFPTTLAPQEQVITVPGPIGPDEIAVVAKEIQGIKAVLTARVVPIWVEPWFARASIVGFRTVWVWEFIPAEFIKTISFANVPVDPEDPDGPRKIDVDVQTTVVLERELLHFWRFVHKDIAIV